MGPYGFFFGLTVGTMIFFADADLEMTLLKIHFSRDQKLTKDSHENLKTSVS